MSDEPQPAEDLSPVCTECGEEWLIPYADKPGAALACPACDLIEVVVVPTYAQAGPPPCEPHDDSWGEAEG